MIGKHTQKRGALLDSNLILDSKWAHYDDTELITEKQRMNNLKLAKQKEREITKRIRFSLG